MRKLIVIMRDEDQELVDYLEQAEVKAQVVRDALTLHKVLQEDRIGFLIRQLTLLAAERPDPETLYTIIHLLSAQHAVQT